jgi:Tol biopolymer transport system component
LVAYESRGNVFIFDRQTKVLEKLPTKEPKRSSGGPEISANGNLIAYHCYLPGRNGDAQPRVSDIFVYNRHRSTLELVTPSFGDLEKNGEALFPHFAGDGRFVVFTSNATDLAAGTKEQRRGVYLFDRYKNSLEMVSRNAAGEPADRPSGDPLISQNGRYIFFKTPSTNLVGKLPETHLSSHLYRIDRWEAAIARVDDEDRSFDEARWVSGRYAINDEGDVVVFEARDKTAPDPYKQLETTNLFIFEPSTSGIRALLPDEYTGKVHGPALSSDGRFVVFTIRDKGQAILNRATQEVKILVPGPCRNAVFSNDGRWIAFESKERLPVGEAELHPPMHSDVNNIYIMENPFKP